MRHSSLGPSSFVIAFVIGYFVIRHFLQVSAARSLLYNDGQRCRSGEIWRVLSKQMLRCPNAGRPDTVVGIHSREVAR